MSLHNYLLIINIVGFVLYLINTWLYSHTSDGQVDRFLTIVSIIGGSLGIVIAIILFDRKSVKDNMMSRVFVFSVLIIQIIIYLILKGNIKSDLNFAIWELFNQHKSLLFYLLGINVIAFVMYWIDKMAAIGHRSRIRIVVLLGLAFAGGSIGAIAAMYLFRHKTRQDYFAVGVPLIIIMQIFFLFYIFNANF